VGGRDKPVCYRCGYKGHLASACKYKSAKCYLCLKVGHLAKICHNSCVNTAGSKKGDGTKGSKSKGKHGCMNLVEAEDMYDSSDSDSSGELHNILPLSNQS